MIPTEQELLTLGEVELLQPNPTMLRVNLLVDADHPILQGHFPDRGIVPGVSQLQAVAQTLAHWLQKPVRMQTASLIKFLTPWFPDENSSAILEVTILNATTTAIEIRSNLRANDVSIMKMNASYLFQITE